MLYRIAGYKQWREIIRADIERAAKMRIVSAFLAVIGMWRMFVFILLMRQVLQRMMQCMRPPGLLREQQDEDERQE